MRLLHSLGRDDSGVLLRGFKKAVAIWGDLLWKIIKSKKYHSDANKFFKDNKLSKKEFGNHILCFAEVIKRLLDIDGDLRLMKELYISNLKFDGIFI